jgi:hypothetical protein
MATTGAKRGDMTEFERANQLAQIAMMYVRGDSQWSIAKHFGLSQQQISVDLKSLEQEWRQSALRDFDDLRGVQLAKIDELEREYWTAWEKSKKPITKTRQEATPKRNRATGESVPTPDKIIKEVRESVGDPRWLDGVHKCIERRCKLLGLDAPQTVDIRLEQEKIAAEVAAMYDVDPKELIAGVEQFLKDERTK